MRSLEDVDEGVANADLGGPTGLDLAYRGEAWHGATGVALIHLFRLLEATAFGTTLADSSSDFALIVSNYLYEEVVAYTPGLFEANMFQPVAVQVKETSMIAAGSGCRPPIRLMRSLDIGQQPQ